VAQLRRHGSQGNKLKVSRSGGIGSGIPYLTKLGMGGQLTTHYLMGISPVCGCGGAGQPPQYLGMSTYAGSIVDWVEQEVGKE
jgi:hypothetical protein